MTIVTDESGNLVAAMRGEVQAPDTSTIVEDTFRCGLLAGPGQKIKVADVPDAIVDLASVTEFHQALQAHIATLGA